MSAPPDSSIAPRRGVVFKSKRLARRIITGVFGDRGMGWLQTRYWVRKLAGDEYFEKEIYLLPDMINAGDVCLDIGANFGQYAVPLARFVGPNGRVIAFEPVPYTNQLVQRVVRALCRNGNVTLYPYATSDREGTIQMEVPKAAQVNQYGRAHIAPGSESGAGDTDVTSIRCVALDEFLSDEDINALSFIKIDVEGAEFMVLRGAERIITTRQPVILCEIEDRHTERYGHRAADVHDFLIERGYAAYIVREGKLAAVSGITTEENNYFFIPADHAAA